jgi:hypothetical protein
MQEATSPVEAVRVELDLELLIRKFLNLAHVRYRSLISFSTVGTKLSAFSLFL